MAIENERCASTMHDIMVSMAGIQIVYRVRWNKFDVFKTRSCSRRHGVQTFHKFKNVPSVSVVNDYGNISFLRKGKILRNLFCLFLYRAQVKLLRPKKVKNFVTLSLYRIDTFGWTLL